MFVPTIFDLWTWPWLVEGTWDIRVHWGVSLLVLLVYHYLKAFVLERLANEAVVVMVHWLSHSWFVSVCWSPSTGILVAPKSGLLVLRLSSDWLVLRRLSVGVCVFNWVLLRLRLVALRHVLPQSCEERPTTCYQSHFLLSELGYFGGQFPASKVAQPKLSKLVRTPSVEEPIGVNSSSEAFLILAEAEVSEPDVVHVQLLRRSEGTEFTWTPNQNLVLRSEGCWESTCSYFCYQVHFQRL